MEDPRENDAPEFWTSTTEKVAGVIVVALAVAAIISFTLSLGM